MGGTLFISVLGGRVSLCSHGCPGSIAGTNNAKQTCQHINKKCIYDSEKPTFSKLLQLKTKDIM